MMTTDNLVSFVLDQLSGWREIRSRRMFGGWHLSIDGIFFAAVHGERLYFKTDETSRKRYESMGMEPFHPRATVTLKSLYEVPVEILEDSDMLVSWAKEAVDCQIKAQKSKFQQSRRIRSNNRREDQ